MTAPLSAGALAEALARALPAGWRMRDRADSDLPALSQLYASTRWAELQAVDWPDEQKLAFLADQFGKQHSHYLQHYPGALWLVMELEGAVAGRIYLHPSERDIRLMDVALVPQLRRQGVGTKLLQALAAEADATGRTISLHVEPYNPAADLYRRLGYADVETRGYYLFMERAPGGVPTAAS